jgi:drug/metabolite transporter (DMT)-like permease
VLILGETLSVQFIIGGLLVLTGIFLVSAKDLLNRRRARLVKEALDS